MAGEVLNIKVCSPLKLHSGLTGKYHEICHYSYNLPLATNRNKILPNVWLLIFYLYICAMRPQKVLDNDMYSALTKVFREKGYEGASLNEIADATGLKKASLYHRFPEGKKQMAEAVFNYIDEWVETKIFKTLNNKMLIPVQRLNESINNIKELYNGGDESCIFRTLSMKVGVELFGDRIKNGMEQWIDHFKELGLAFGQSKEEAKNNAVQNLIDIQGSLIVSEGLKDLNIFENTLQIIKNRYSKE